MSRGGTAKANSPRRPKREPTSALHLNIRKATTGEGIIYIMAQKIGRERNFVKLLILVFFDNFDSRAKMASWRAGMCLKGFPEAMRFMTEYGHVVSHGDGS